MRLQMGRPKEFQMFIMSFGGSKDFQITQSPNYWKNLNVNNNVMGLTLPKQT